MARIEPLDPHDYYRADGNVIPKMIFRLNALIAAHNVRELGLDTPAPEPERILPTAKELWDTFYGAPYESSMKSYAACQLATVEAACKWLRGQVVPGKYSSPFDVYKMCVALLADARRVVDEAK